MARAIATGTISFGLVSIPVRLHAATQPAAGLSFNLLHKDCGSRLKQQYLCARDGSTVPREAMVKGYEVAKDQYVTFTPDELKSLEEKGSQILEIAEFVPLDKIDPVYFDKPYYLSPEKGGEKAYRLLADVMRQTGRTALARYAARGKQYLVMIRPIAGAQGGGDGLVMQQLLYADEVRPFSEVPIPEAVIKDQELMLARQLVDQISSDGFSPTKYKDEVRERINADIQKKIEGQEIATSEPEEMPAQVIDLMEALKASLGGGTTGKAARKGPKAANKPAAGDDDVAMETPRRASAGGGAPPRPHARNRRR